MIKIIQEIVGQINADPRESLVKFQLTDKILLELESRVINSTFRQLGIEHDLAELAVRLLNEKEPDERWPEESGFARSALLLGTVVLLRSRLTLLKARLLATTA